MLRSKQPPPDPSGAPAQSKLQSLSPVSGRSDESCKRSNRLRRRRRRSCCRSWCPCVDRRPTRLRPYHSASTRNLSGAFPRLVCPVLFRRVSKPLASTIDEARANSSGSADGCRVPEFERCSVGVQSVECQLRWTARRDKDRITRRSGASSPLQSDAAPTFCNLDGARCPCKAAICRA